MNLPRIPHLGFLAVLLVAVAVPAANAQLIAVEEDTGNLYAISTADAALELIGTTGISDLGALEFNALDGYHYGMTTGESASLYRIDISSAPETIGVEFVGELGYFMYEGGLAFTPDGTAYGFNAGATVPYLFTVDLETGAATIINPTDGRHDIAGLGWRDDGVLIGLDSSTASLLTIDPVTAATGLIEQVVPVIGGIGGMALEANGGYFVTGGPLAVSPGSNELYSFDPLSGEQFFIGTFEDTSTGTGLSGLAVVPEPATLTLLAAAGLGLLHRRRK